MWSRNRTQVVKPKEKFQKIERKNMKITMNVVLDKIKSVKLAQLISLHGKNSHLYRSLENDDDNFDLGKCSQ